MPSPGLTPIEDLEPALQRFIHGGRKAIEERPIFTRRALFNSIPGDDMALLGQNMTKYAPQYIGYTFASGPWRDAIVRFGIDPRSDPKYRIYQTTMFQLEPGRQGSWAKYNGARPRSSRSQQEIAKQSHLFDGVNVGKDGKVWQICDITDPFLTNMIANSDLRAQCHVS